MAGASLAGIDDRGRHLDKSTLLLSSTLAPAVDKGVDNDCEGVVGGVVDLLGSNDDVREVDALDALFFQPAYESPNRPLVG